ncbi:MAG: DUF1254 domain-containing protein [Ruminococcus sp.]|nr:DUF1254 domain-containing protein [Ruminococcus sp.]
MKRFAASADSETVENIWEIVEDAYVYAFPLVLMDATKISATNTEEAFTEKAPVNQFIHSAALADAQFRTVVTPNVDTIYSQVWYDLSEEPMVYELPETDRFCKVQVLDGWTNTAAVLDKVLSMDTITFFNKANDMMVKNSPAAVDKEMLEKIAAVNIGPGMEFDTSVLTGDVAENWKTMLTEVRLKLIKEGQKFSKKLGQWDYFGEPIGDFNTEYAYRALVALAGLGANTVEVALYPKIEQDADGNTLTGEKSYILHFESYPQVLEGGFWSVTAYGDDDFLIDNPIDRYCINDRSDLKANDDGSVDIILSEDAPENTTNWLPVGDGGFHLYMRIYTPDMDALDTWTAPTITEIAPSNVN